MNLTKIALAVLLCSTVVGACAGPQLQVPKASPAAVELERQRQLGLVQDQKDIKFTNQVEQWRRVYGVYSRLRTGGADLCKNDVAPFWGLWLTDLNVYPPEQRDRAKRILNLDNNVSILAAGGNAAAAGLRAGDTVTRIDGVTLSSQPRLETALTVLQKAGMRPVQIEIGRDGKNFSTVLKPEPGCRYQVRIESSPVINAGANGNLIVIYSGLIELVNNDDELAHVLSHELAHNVLGHIDRSKTNASVGALIGAVVDIGLLVGAGVNTQGALAQTGAHVGGRAYSQEFEREADYMSLYFMVKAGFDATKAPDMQRKFGIVQPGSMQNNYASTHPSTPERAANLELAMQEVAGKVLRQEPLVPTKIESQVAPVENADVNAQRVLQEQVKVEQQRPATERVAALKPLTPERKPESVRRTALLTHVKGRTMSSPPMVLQAEYMEAEEGRGTSRVIYPGTYFLEGEFRLLPIDQSFRGTVTPRLIDPDKVSISTSSSQKGFAAYANSDGTGMECFFGVSSDGRINQGTCADNRGNQYRISY
jgi:beta-barrel assembly-enhancing protease